MRSLTIIASALTLSVGAALCGCSTEGEAGGYNHVTGNMTGTLNAPLDQAHSAAVAAAKDMAFQVTKDSSDAMQSVVAVKDANDHTIDIRLKKVTDKTTEVTINQGIFTGSESEAKTLFDKIKGHVPPM